MDNVFKLRFDRLLIALGAGCCLLLLGQSAFAQEMQKVKVLLVDGQNNHPWQETSTAIVKMLSETDRFQVEQATSPAAGEDLSNFRPRFSAFDVVLLNYNGLAWSEATNNDLVDYVARGGGLVVFHAAGSAFPKWKEYNDMLGLSGFNHRNETAGPWLRLQQGEWVADPAPGKAGQARDAAPYLVETFNTEHPIMKGVPDKWLHAADQLYFDLRGPARNLQVLAFADSEQEGPRRYAPVIWTVAYEEGRVFHTTMGHDLGAVSCLGFVTLMRRGVEWAATGSVSLTVPSDFPTADEAQSWKPSEP